MKKHIILGLTAALLSGTAMAAETTSIKSLPAEGVVSLHGTVDSVQNEREFTLRDSTGTIGVDIESGQSLTIKAGDEVTVTGKVDKDIAGTDINATNVQPSKGVAQNLSDAAQGIPGVSTTDAQAFNISSLPDKGAVKITGTVSDVDNEKEFTLRDETGSINIDVESSENAALTKGARVTVIGTVDSGMLGKDVNASKVIVLANAKTTAN